MSTERILPATLSGYHILVNEVPQAGDVLTAIDSISPVRVVGPQGYTEKTDLRGVTGDGHGAYRAYRKDAGPFRTSNPNPHGLAAGRLVDLADLPDSGARSTYSTGAVRDASAGKGHFHSIPPVALRKLAERFEAGAKKYSANNWMKGIPLSHYIDSLTRHQLAFAEGDVAEDHAGAIIWNACAMVWTDEEIKAQRLPSTLDDLPYRNRLPVKTNS
jgi:hypothetical protein